MTSDTAYRVSYPESLHLLLKRINRLIRRDGLSESWKHLRKKYGRVLLDNRQVEGIILARERGTTNGHTTNLQDISERKA
jgi:hypothetical protein